MTDRHIPKSLKGAKHTIQSSSGLALIPRQINPSSSYFTSLQETSVCRCDEFTQQLCWCFDLAALIQPVPAFCRGCSDLALLSPLSRRASRWPEGCLQGSRSSGCVRVCGRAHGRACVSSRTLCPSKEACSATGASLACASTDETAKQNKPPETATGGFVIRQAILWNLESSIHYLLPGRWHFLKGANLIKYILALTLEKAIPPTTLHPFWHTSAHLSHSYRYSDNGMMQMFPTFGKGCQWQSR